MHALFPKCIFDELFIPFYLDFFFLCNVMHEFFFCSLFFFPFFLKWVLLWKDNRIKKKMSFFVLSVPELFWFVKRPPGCQAVVFWPYYSKSDIFFFFFERILTCNPLLIPHQGTQFPSASHSLYTHTRPILS